MSPRSFRMMWLSSFSLVCVQLLYVSKFTAPTCPRRSWLIWISCVANQWLFGSYIIILWILCLTWSSFLVVCSCLIHLRTVAPSQDAILSYSWWESIYGGVDFFNEFQSYRQFGSIFSYKMFHIDSTIQHLVDLSWFATYWYGIAKRNWYQSSKAWFWYVFAGPPLSQPWWWIPMVIDHMSHVSTAAGSCWP